MKKLTHRNSIINHGNANPYTSILPLNENEFWDFEQIKNYIVMNLDGKDKIAILDIPSAEGMIQYHHSIGTWIRNTFKLWHENNPHTIDKHPDDISHEILKGVWQTIVLRENIGL